jgi:hypothetical protein
MIEVIIFGTGKNMMVAAGVMDILHFDAVKMKESIAVHATVMNNLHHHLIFHKFSHNFDYDRVRITSHINKEDIHRFETDGNELNGSNSAKIDALTIERNTLKFSPFLQSDSVYGSNEALAFIGFRRLDNVYHDLSSVLI